MAKRVPLWEWFHVTYLAGLAVAMVGFLPLVGLGLGFYPVEVLGGLAVAGFWAWYYWPQRPRRIIGVALAAVGAAIFAQMAFSAFIYLSFACAIFTFWAICIVAGWGLWRVVFRSRSFPRRWQVQFTVGIVGGVLAYLLVALAPSRIGDIVGNFWGMVFVLGVWLGFAIMAANFVGILGFESIAKQEEAAAVPDKTE